MTLEHRSDGRVLTLTLEHDRIDLALTIAGVDVPPPLPLEHLELRWLIVAAGPAVLAAHAAAPERRTAGRRPWANRSNGAAPTADATERGGGDKSLPCTLT